MLLKFFRNWSGNFKVIPIFTFLKFWKISVFWDYLENPLRYVGVPGDKQVSTHDMKTFDVVFFDPPFLTMEGWGKICLFRLFELSGNPVKIHQYFRGKKVTTHDNKTFVGFCFEPMVITVVGREISFLFLNNFCSTQLIYLKFYIWGFLGVPYWIMMWKCENVGS